MSHSPLPEGQPALRDEAGEVIALNMRTEGEYWTCVGDERGCCSIHHRTREAAEQCCAKDRRLVAQAYRFAWLSKCKAPPADRHPVRVVDGRVVERSDKDL